MTFNNIGRVKMDLKICRICLRTEAKMYRLDRYQLKSYYEEVLALKVNDRDGLPHYFCYECSMMLHKFHKFKEKCHTGQKLLKEMLWRGPISYEAVYKVDRADYGLQSVISPSTADKVKLCVFYDSDIINPKDENVNENDTVDADNSSTDNECNDNECNDNECKEEILLSDSMKVEDDEESTDPKNVTKTKNNEITYVEIKTEKESKIRPAKIGRRNKRKHYNSDGEETNIKDLLLTSDHWEVVTMNEEEAEKAFKERSEDKKYIEAPYKCTNCFKGFSKEMILKRHIKLRHSESIGNFVCRFCHVRYKLDCYLRKHMRQHYAKYKCLRCSLVCDLEYTAFLHNEYHSGVVKKCVYCDEEFRHSSTYYSHLRRHRSEFVCALCGASFVSNAGLHQHKRVTHALDQLEVEDDDDEALITYCSRCDIRFETSKAYREHLFHSVLHSEEATEDMEDGETMPKKILGKKLQKKISNDLQLPKINEEPIPRAYKKKEWGKTRKSSKKPTTCRQCGKSFDTQMACMKHHVSEHPRTPFFTERIICEICGASLALGSVSSHHNMHTKEVMHSCATCGRQFHSSVSYKRHQLTHTGAKPYGCTLCDKRFTQSNSLKLHYRTFHLKEPYPKRNRRKKTELKEPLEPATQATDDDSEDSQGPSATQRRTEPATSALLSNNDVHYLTLQ